MSDPWIICPACQGDGTCVNPNIDSHGLTADDFAEDPDFAEDYINGIYNVDCAACGGSGKIRESVVADLDEAAADRDLAAREDGVWEPGIRDYRYGTSSR